MVVDHRIWLKDVAAYLAAETHILLARVQLRLFLFTSLNFRLVQLVLQQPSAAAPASGGVAGKQK